MIDYDWLYLCSDPRRLAITLQLLPPEMRQLRSMQICYCSHLDGPGRVAELHNTATEFAPKWLKFDVRNLSPLVQYCPPQLKKYYYGTGKARWALGVKLLLPFLYPEDWRPFLYTDDDVLVVDDPYFLMMNSFGTAGNFKFFKGNKRLFPLAQELMSLTSLNYSSALDAPHVPADTYDANIMDAGIFFMKYPDDWREMLDRFAALPYLSGLDTESHEFRRIDQRFLTVFGIQHGWDKLTKAPQRRNCYSHPTKFRIPTLVKGTTFVHYKTGQHKADWMAALETFLLERK